MARKHQEGLVTRSGEKLIFTGEIRDFTLNHFCRQLAGGGNDRRLVLDFSDVSGAFPEAMVPIIAASDRLRYDGVSVDVLEPQQTRYRRIFERSGWLELLKNGFQTQSTEGDFEQNRVQRFTDGAQQNSVVTALTRFLLRNMETSRSVLHGLEWSTNEITDNVLNHAQSEIGGLVQATVLPDIGMIDFVVADSGRGILASMQEAFTSLRDDKSAIEEAIKQGVTSGPGQGNGLAGTLRIALRSGGLLRVSSGCSQLYVHAERDGTPEQRFFRRSNYQGTIVQARIGIESTFDLTDALTFEGEVKFGDWGLIDSRYEQDSHMRLVVSQEARGLGSRESGRELRTSAKNLLTSNPGLPLVVDWSGIPLVSSSFADEFLGKLFLEMGPISFGQRVLIEQVEPLVRELIDKAISQRMRQ